MWISVDGVEGTGKTTIATHLAQTLPVELAPEFSDSVFGHALRAAVTASPHYISSSPLGQSLVFLADFLEVHASCVAPRLDLGVSVVSDRGYLSKYAYRKLFCPALWAPRQHAVCSTRYSHTCPHRR